MSLIILAVIACVALVFIGIYNGIVGAKNDAAESFSAIDTVLQKRYDLIPNLVEVVKQYAAHEAGTLTKVTELRSKLLTNHDASPERFEQENALYTGMKSIFAIAENYPDLKASANFLELQAQWSEIEDNLLGARRAYNAAAKELQNKKEMFPSNIVAGMMTVPAYPMYEADEAAKTYRPDAKQLFNN
ncbi:MAG: LemA family protein [Patescibacteria group bacterium]